MLTCCDVGGRLQKTQNDMLQNGFYVTQEEAPGGLCVTTLVSISVHPLRWNMHSADFQKSL